MNRRRPAALALLLVIAALALALPPHWKGRLAIRGMAHHVAHVTAFCAAFLMLAARPKNPRKNLAVVFGLLAFGVLIEVLQTAMYGIRFEYSDAADDALGVAAGLLIDLAYRCRSEMNNATQS